MNWTWWRPISAGVCLIGFVVSGAQARCPSVAFRLEAPGIEAYKESRQEKAERYRRIAAACAAEGRFEKARKGFVRAIGLDPLNACAINGLACWIGYPELSAAWRMLTRKGNQT